MKKYLLIALLFGLGMSVAAQQDFDTFYKAHKNDSGVEGFSVPGLFIKYMLRNSDEPEMEALVKKMNGVSFLIADTEASELKQALSENLPEAQYKDMMEVKDGTTTILFKAKEGKKGIEEIVLTIDEPESFFVMGIEGKFTTEDAKQLIQSVNVNESKNTPKGD